MLLRGKSISVVPKESQFASKSALLTLSAVTKISTSERESPSASMQFTSRVPEYLTGIVTLENTLNPPAVASLG